MTNDAKLGLVLGVAIVLVIALVFFRTDPSVARTPIDPHRSLTATRSGPDARQFPATQISAQSSP